MNNSSVFKLENNKSLFTDYFSANTWLVFLLLCSIGVGSMYVQQNFILNDDIFYNTFGEQFAKDRIGEMLESQKKYRWLGYFMVPIVLIIQTFLIAICLNVGTILLDIKTTFGKLFSITLKALVVFAFGKIIIIGLAFFTEINSVEDIVSANIFSLLGIIGQENVPQWSWYPLGLINLFELLFWFFLAIGLLTVLSKTFKKTLKFILITYGTGLLIWTLFVMSLQLGVF